LNQSDPFQSGEFDRFEAPPWPAPMDDLCLVETDDRFGKGVVVTVPDTSKRWLYTCCCKPLAVENGHVLNNP
jgi:hypothetical protein